MSTTTVQREAAGTRRKPDPIWRCQFCAQGHHRSCPRATLHNGKLWLCRCEDGQDQHHGEYCLHCKHDRPDELSAWACVDSHACAVRRQQRNESNPVWRMIQRARVHGAVERRAKRLKMESALAGIDPYSDESIDRVHAILNTIEGLDRKGPKKKREPKPPKPRTGACECCGGETKGGRFLPGHDARLASRLVGRVVSGDAEAYEDLKARNWLQKLPLKVRTEWESK